jgi:hypothetical protein
VTGGEYQCRVCGLLQPEAIWGTDGQCPTYCICDCCGCEFGYEDSSLEGIRRHRESWLRGDGVWFEADKKPSDWNRDEQLALVPAFYLRVLAGLPGTGPPPLPFSATGTGTHAEGFVVEFTLPTSETWVGNFQPGAGGASLALATPDAAHALVVSAGQGYVVEPTERALLRCFGASISDVLFLPEQGALILGNGLWFERVEKGALVWKSRRISWDGMMNVTVAGATLAGEAYDPMTDAWMPFEVDVETGQLRGGSYPLEV